MFKTQKAHSSIASNSGFTLVELMVVVAIIGILAAIAIPNFQKYQARARQSEAKIALAGAYTAEKSYAVENSSFSACLPDIGYVPSGARIFYAVGWTSAIGTGTTCGTAATGTACNTTFPGGAVGPTCTTNNTGSVTFAAASTFWPANAKTNGATGALPADTDLTSPAPGVSLLTTSTFVVNAVGNISTSVTTFDKWSMSDAKIITNTLIGL